MNNQRSTVYPRKRLRIVATLATTLLVAMLAPGFASGSAVGPSPAAPEFVNGSGNAYAQFFRVGPTAARLSLAPILGLSLADYVGTLGRGQVTAAEWAALGVAEPTLPDNTPGIRVESTDPGSDKGKTEYVAGGTDAGGNGGGLMELHARATKAPLGESRYRLARFGIPGFFETDEGEAHTVSGLVSTPKGMVRESRATVDIKAVNLGGGAASLSGLHWEAVQRTGAGGKKVTGSFTVQGAKIGPQELNIPAGGAQLESVLGPINTALAPTGFAIRPPNIDTDTDVARVSPLSIEIVDSPLGRQIFGPILEAAQPLREPLVDAILEASDGEAAVLILVADLTLGIFSGASQLHIELGGVNAFTEGEAYVSPFSDVVKLPPIGTGPQTVFVPGRAGTPAIPGTPGDNNARLVAAAPPRTKTIPGDRGGVAVLVGLIGLAVAAGLAAADWYRMRSARQAAA